MAVCSVYPSGVIRISRSCPRAAIPIAIAHGKPLRRIVEVWARHGYHGELLVPGVPEATNEKEALEKVDAFRRQIMKRLADEAFIANSEYLRVCPPISPL